MSLNNRTSKALRTMSSASLRTSFGILTSKARMVAYLCSRREQMMSLKINRIVRSRPKVGTRAYSTLCSSMTAARMTSFLWMPPMLMAETGIFMSPRKPISASSEPEHGETSSVNNARGNQIWIASKAKPRAPYPVLTPAR
jgi:hypothetical protein